ncbi:aminodeoxychorismate synthase component I [Candidatus Omnitrophota bacterium]
MESHTQLKSFLSSQKEGIFLYDAFSLSAARKSYLFIDPIKKIVSKDSSAVAASLYEVEKFLKKGYYAAGYITYEAGYALEGKFEGLLNGQRNPLLNFGVFKERSTFTNLDINEFFEDSFTDDFWLNSIRPSISKREYKKQFETIKEYIKNGDVYQINYCFNLLFNVQGNIGSLFNALTKKQKVSYAAFIKEKNTCILSLSPEMFFRLDGKQITMKPMKGTLLKKGDNKKNKQRRGKFHQSVKNRAENLMIVDLIRNDCSRFCEVSSVKVPHLYSVEEYETLYQMTSTIIAKMRYKTSLVDIFRGIFPSGSVTGAPKIRAMEIIDELEAGKRGIYTGAIGYFEPHMKKALFNIPIRTMVIDVKSREGGMGIGSGVVADSKAQLEYNECMGKAQFIKDVARRYSLIETMLFSNKTGYFLLNAHLERIKKSAAYFGIIFSENALKSALNTLKTTMKGPFKYRVKLLISEKGKITLQQAKLANTQAKKGIVSLSSHVIDQKNIFFYHKTTNRKLYDTEYKKCIKKGFVDTIFTNNKDEITEGAISNIFIKKKGIFYTPPVKCGLLPGVYRNYVLSKNKTLYKEKILLKNDIVKADGVYICNSVRGMKRVYFNWDI